MQPISTPAAAIQPAAALRRPGASFWKVKHPFQPFLRSPFRRARCKTAPPVHKSLSFMLLHPSSRSFNLSFWSRRNWSNSNRTTAFRSPRPSEGRGLGRGVTRKTNSAPRLWNHPRWPIVKQTLQLWKHPRPDWFNDNRTIRTYLHMLLSSEERKQVRTVVKTNFAAYPPFLKFPHGRHPTRPPASPGGNLGGKTHVALVA
jgi:hypothetical protein